MEEANLAIWGSKRRKNPTGDKQREGLLLLLCYSAFQHYVISYREAKLTLAHRFLEVLFYDLLAVGTVRTFGKTALYSRGGQQGKTAQSLSMITKTREGTS